MDRQVEVHDACRDFWEGFNVLSKARAWYPGGTIMIPGYIAYSEMTAYAKDHFYADVAELDLFVYLVQALDSIYIEHMRKVAATKNPKKPTQ